MKARDTSSDGVREAMHWAPSERGEGWVACNLCAQHCTIAPGRPGRCGVRENRGGRLYTLIYGLASSIALDPMEKKPLYHYHPGERVLSLGTVGCNLRCLMCQNHTISQARPGDVPLHWVEPEAVVAMARKERARAVAFTYNEPTIWHEFALDCCRLAKAAGLGTVYVTNGLIEEAPLRELAPYLEAMNVDLKGDDRFYREVCGGPLDGVRRTLVLAQDLGIHLELTTLVVPGYNDSEEALRGLVSWVADALGPDVPLHFSRFHPDYKLTDLPPTPVETLERAYHLAKEAGMRYVYIGNVILAGREDSLCPNCGALLVRRSGYRVRVEALRQGRCSVCGEPVPFIQD